MSLQHQQRRRTPSTSADIINERSLRPRDGRKRRTETLSIATHVRPARRARQIERIRARETETGREKREKGPERENKGVQMSGRPAWPQQNVLPDLLPSSDSRIEPSTDTGAKPGPRERSARLRHRRPGLDRADVKERDKENVFMRACKREAGADGDRGRRGRRWRPLRPWIKHLSTAVRSRFWCRSLPRRNSKGSPPSGHRVSAVSRQIRNWLYLLIVVQKN